MDLRSRKANLFQMVFVQTPHKIVILSGAPRRGVEGTPAVLILPLPLGAFQPPKIDLQFTSFAPIVQ
jgi:hypothetical protein